MFYPKVTNEEYKKLTETTWEDMELNQKENIYTVTMYNPTEKMEFEVFVSEKMKETLDQKTNQANQIKASTQASNNNAPKIIKFTSIDDYYESLGETEINENGTPIYIFSSSTIYTDQSNNQAMQSENEITNVFQIEQFGMWNCDTPKKLPQGMLAANPIFLDEQQDTIKYNCNRYLTENDYLLGW